MGRAPPGPAGGDSPRLWLASLALLLAAGGYSAEDHSASTFDQAWRAVAQRERAYWGAFRERQRKAVETAREPWREVIASMNGRGTRVDLSVDHMGFRSLYREHAAHEMDRVLAAKELAQAAGAGAVAPLWSALLRSCDEIDLWESRVLALRDPGGETWAGTDQEPGIRRHGLAIRVDGLVAALGAAPGASSFVAAEGWEQAVRADGKRSITRRVAALDVLASCGAPDGLEVGVRALGAGPSALRVAALECVVRLAPAPRTELLALLEDPSAPVRRALFATVRQHAPDEPRWIPPLVRRLPATRGLERLQCLAALVRLARRDLGATPDAWREWCDRHLEALENRTVPPADAASTAAPGPRPSTTSFYGATPLSEGIVFVLEGGDNLLVPAEYDVQRTRAYFDWPWGRQGWQKEHRSHGDVQFREFTEAVARLDATVAFAVVMCTDNGGFKTLGEDRILRGGPRDPAQAAQFLESHAPRGYRSEISNLRTAFDLARLPVGAIDFPAATADTILMVADGSLRGGPYLDPEAAALAFARWNRFRRVALHTIRICNAGDDSEDFLRRLAEGSGGTHRWQRVPP